MPRWPLLGTVRPDELVDPGITPDRLLYRLFQRHGPRVFRALPLKAGCRCSQGRVREVLSMFPRREVEAMVEEGRIVVTCQFCNRTYVFAPEEVAAGRPTRKGGHMRTAHGYALRALAMAAALLVAACQVPAPAPVFPELSYTHLGTLRLDVGSVEVIDDYVPPLVSPHVEHEFPVTPAGAAARWGSDRIAAGGAEGKARVIITEAGVRATTLEKRRGVVGAFYIDQEYRFDGVLEVTVEVRSARGFRNAFATARATYRPHRPRRHHGQRPLADLL